MTPQTQDSGHIISKTCTEMCEYCNHLILGGLDVIAS